MKNLPAKVKATKMLWWKKFIPTSILKLEKGSKAAVFVDKNKVPRVFVFDVFALLDMLSKIDEELVDRLPDTEYNDKRANPAGALIDEIESRLPVNPKLVARLKASIAEAKEKGWVSFEEVKKRLRLA